MDLADLAAGQSVSRLPDVARPGRPVRRSRNPFIAKLRESYRLGEAYTLPAVPRSEVKRVRAALRYASVITELGCHIRERTTAAGVVISYQAHARRTREGGRH